MVEVEQKLTGLIDRDRDTPIDTPSQRINTRNKELMDAIQTTGNRHISRGNRRKHNPNFTQEIKGLIIQRDTLPKTSPKPFTAAIIQQLHALNTGIDTKIIER